jgi:hypothetical protein
MKLLTDSLPALLIELIAFPTADKEHVIISTHATIFILFPLSYLHTGKLFWKIKSAPPKRYAGIFAVIGQGFEKPPCMTVSPVCSFMPEHCWAELVTSDDARVRRLHCVYLFRHR